MGPYFLPKMKKGAKAEMEKFYSRSAEDVLKELMEVEVNTMSTLDALNTLYRLQNKLKNRWQGGKDF